MLVDCGCCHTLVSRISKFVFRQHHPMTETTGDLITFSVLLPNKIVAIVL